MRSLVLTAVCACLISMAAPAAAFDVIFGHSWDSIALQAVLDGEYGAGAIDAATGYEGYLLGDAPIPYWEDQFVYGFVIREIAGYRNRNTMGWYAEDLSGSTPAIDGTDDGVILDGPASAGDPAVTVNLGSVTRFGFYLDPNGPFDSTNAPQGEYFFTNRFLNDIGEDGSILHHAPSDGDPQALIYNITHLRGGIPTYVIAWEDLDYGSRITYSGESNATDDDFNDLVVEISAASPVTTEAVSWSKVKSLFEQ